MRIQARHVFILTTYALLSHYKCVLSEAPKDYDRLPTLEDNQRMYEENKSLPLSLNDVEKLFRYKETMEFLNSFEDPVHRDIIRQQLMYCPYNALCTFSFNLFLIDVMSISACYPCSCESNCTYNCCPDILSYKEWVDSNENIAPKTDDCFRTYLKPKDIIKDDGYQLVYRCKGVDWQHQNVCFLGYSTARETLDEVTPVTDTENQISYINRQCALCNNISNESLMDWNFELRCTQTNVLYDVETNIVDFVRNIGQCNLKFTPRGQHYNTCRHVIGNCNVTGRWKTFDYALLSGCLFYEMEYIVPPNINRSRPLLSFRYFIILSSEPGQSISYKITYAPSEDSDQPAHQRSLSGGLA